jgi:hypothetical protein
MTVGLGPLLLLAAPLRTVSLAFIPPSFSASREPSDHSEGSPSFQSPCFKSSSAFLVPCPTSLVIRMYHRGRYKIDSIILLHGGQYLNIWEGNLYIQTNRSICFRWESVYIWKPDGDMSKGFQAVETAKEHCS